MTKYQEVLEELGISSMNDLDIPKLFKNLVKSGGGFDIEHLYEITKNNPEMLKLYPNAIKGKDKELKVINKELTKYKDKVGNSYIDLKFYNYYMNNKAGSSVSYSDFIKKLKQNRDALETIEAINELSQKSGSIESVEIEYWLKNLASYFKDPEKKELSSSDKRTLPRIPYEKPIIYEKPIVTNETKQSEKPKVKMKRINVGYISVKDDLSWKDVIIAGKKIGGKVRKDPKIYKNSDGEGLLLPVDDYKLSFKMFSEEPVISGKYIESIRFQICEISKNALNLKQIELKELGEEVLKKLAKQLKGKFTKI